MSVAEHDSVVKLSEIFSPSKRQQTIFRIAKRERDFTIIPNATLRDSRLSLPARALLAFALSHEDHWVFHGTYLREKLSLGDVRFNRIIRELEAAGYCIRERERKSDGTLSTVEYLFAETPDELQPLIKNGGVDAPATDQNPGTKKTKRFDIHRRKDSPAIGIDRRATAAAATRRGRVAS